MGPPYVIIICLHLVVTQLPWPVSCGLLHVKDRSIPHSQWESLMPIKESRVYHFQLVTADQRPVRPGQLITLTLLPIDWPPERLFYLPDPSWVSLGICFFENTLLSICFLFSCYLPESRSENRIKNSSPSVSLWCSFSPCWIFGWHSLPLCFVEQFSSLVH